MWNGAKVILGLCIHDDKSRWPFAFIPHSRGTQKSAPLTSDWNTPGGETKQWKYPDLGTPTTASWLNFFMRADQGHGGRFYENETLQEIDWTEFGDDSFCVHATFFRAWQGIKEEGRPHLARKCGRFDLFQTGIDLQHIANYRKQEYFMSTSRVNVFGFRRYESQLPQGLAWNRNSTFGD